jgi:hypothetical protein
MSHQRPLKLHPAFEAKLSLAAETLRNHMDAAE